VDYGESYWEDIEDDEKYVNVIHQLVDALQHLGVAAEKKEI